MSSCKNIGVPGLSGTVRRWKINPERLAEGVCTVVTRALTEEEWDRFVGADIPYSDYMPCPARTQ